MRRSAALACALALAGCTTDTAQTTAVEQGITDCVPGGNFKNAKMIAQPWWNGAQPPPPGSTSGYVLWLDPQGTYWNALLADPVAGSIKYAVKLTPQQLGGFVAVVAPYGRIDVSHVPPIPNPEGGDGIARFALEYWLRIEPVFANAVFASH
jgi:hypothetical protein